MQTSICNVLQAPLPYQFQYQVEDPQAPEGPLDFGHQEARDERVTNGQYSVLLPDGRIQVHPTIYTRTLVDASVLRWGHM